MASAPGLSDNARKHTSTNPLQRLLIDRFYATLIGLLRELEFETLLDAGSGEGFTLARLAPHVGAARLIATDRELSALLFAGVFPAGVPRVCADVTRLPYADAAFDVVLTTEVLEHLPQPADGLRELGRVARRYVVCTVPHEPYFRLANVLRGKNVAAFGNDPGHVQHWSRRQFATFVGAELRVHRCVTSFPWTLVVAEPRLRGPRLPT
ncbi:MAG: class I SAM-dependent methyltransferase [bacterium]